MNELVWRTWAEQMATGLVLVDPELRLRWVNPALTEWLELGLRSPLGQPLDVLLGEALEALAQAARVLAEQRPTQCRGVPLTATNGREIRADILALERETEGLIAEIVG